MLMHYRAFLDYLDLQCLERRGVVEGLGFRVWDPLR